MIALRTNDNPLQSAKVDAWLRENATARSPAYVDHIVLCELALYETGPADFSGYLLAERARGGVCTRADSGQEGRESGDTPVVALSHLQELVARQSPP